MQEIRLYFHANGLSKIYPQNGFEVWQAGRYQIGVDFNQYEYVVWRVECNTVIPEKELSNFTDAADLIQKVSKYIEDEKNYRKQADNA